MKVMSPPLRNSPKSCGDTTTTTTTTTTTSTTTTTTTTESPFSPRRARSLSFGWFFNVLVVVVLLSFCGLPVLVRAGEHSALDRVRTNFPDWQPQAIIDVGANQGTWFAHMANQYPQSKFLLLEASRELQSTLQQLAVAKLPANQTQVVTALLGSRPDQAQPWFEAPGGRTGNSIFREAHSKLYNNMVPQQRKTSTLDQIKHNSALLKDARIDILKLDVQGAELLVLQGATNLVLKEVSFIQVEASLVQKNVGAACWHDVDAFLRQHGFALYDAGDWNYDPHAFHTHGVGQFDPLYVRVQSPYLPEGLVRLQPQFCGHQNNNNNHGPTNNNNNNEPAWWTTTWSSYSSSRSLVDNDNNNNNKSDLSSWLGWLVSFALGYVCAKSPWSTMGRSKRTKL